MDILVIGMVCYLIGVGIGYLAFSPDDESEGD
jgi:hypothetical protein